jgi:hypothetical protein
VLLHAGAMLALIGPVLILVYQSVGLAISRTDQPRYGLGGRASRGRFAFTRGLKRRSKLSSVDQTDCRQGYVFNAIRQVIGRWFLVITEPE